MRKLSRKQHLRDVRLGIGLRKNSKSYTGRFAPNTKDQYWKAINNWIDRYKAVLNIYVSNKRRVEITLPEKMNFYKEYEFTVLYLSAIRKLVDIRKPSYKSYKLASVNFDKLKDISTSAALVLTAELSKWDDKIRQKLRPKTDNWEQGIYEKLRDLGFFDLFSTKPPDYDESSDMATDVRLVRYIKGKCGDSNKARILKEQIKLIVGDSISKWTFLHGGLTEAITNVTHHAYPDKSGFSSIDKNWYLSGSFNVGTKELKIVFYDQGIGIPRSLPASAIWERVLKLLDKLPLADRKKDEILLRAAVELDRTSTGQSDRGKGLQDLLEFIKQRGEGYLSIISQKGLFKYSMHNGNDNVKTEHFSNAVCGTLIIWSATLDG